MVLAVPNQSLGNSSNPNTTSYDAEGEKSVSLPDSQCYTVQRSSFSPLNQVENAFEGYGLFPRPWFEFAGTIRPRLLWYGTLKLTRCETCKAEKEKKEL